MKVGTLACIFGAVIRAENPEDILDIGTGTGLLALMIAQRFPATQIDAIEINKEAFEQAEKNVANSSWNNRINIFFDDFLNWNPDKKYDLIITNPPFFQDHLKSPRREINLARHTDQLPHEKLVCHVVKILREQGAFWVVLPHYQSARLEQLANQKGLFKSYQMEIFNFRGQKPAAIINRYALSKSKIEFEKLVIREGQQTYSKRFVNLLKDFYLNF